MGFLKRGCFYHFLEATADDEPAFMYYVNDGVYGSFNCLLYDHAEVEPSLLDVSTLYHVWQGL